MGDGVGGWAGSVHLSSSRVCIWLFGVLTGDGDGVGIGAGASLYTKICTHEIPLERLRL